jgi:hypothetical protein
MGQHETARTDPLGESRNTNVSDTVKRAAACATAKNAKNATSTYSVLVCVVRKVASREVRATHPELSRLYHIASSSRLFAHTELWYRLAKRNASNYRLCVCIV